MASGKMINSESIWKRHWRFVDGGKISNKYIEFKFLASYNGDDNGIRLINENDVEVVCLLGRSERK